jgi:ferredoxin
MSKIITTKEKGIIYYFSGTGNSLFIAKEYQKRFVDKKIIVELSDISEIDVVSSQSKYDFIVVCFPVYAAMPPKIVTDFVRKFPVVKHKSVYIFATCGQASGASLSYLQHIFEKKGYLVNFTQEYIMPQNLFAKKNKDVKKTIKEAEEKIKINFSEICLGESKYIKSNKIKIFLYKIVSWVFQKFVSSKKGNWIVDYSKCNFCGLCQELCPTKNITLKKKKQKIVFSNNCVFCTRCFNFCPQNAIQFKKIKDEKPTQYNYFKKYFIR